MKYSNITIEENFDLSQVTSFGIGGRARYFVRARSERELMDAMRFQQEKNLPYFIIGRGSNILVSDNGFEGLVLQYTNEKIKKISEDDSQVTINVGSGIVGDDLVETVVSNGWWGLENMSSIPGSLGGWIVQNAGAYGAEIFDRVENVQVYNIETKRRERIEKADCSPTYRSSIFSGSKKYIILSVDIRLDREGRANLSYPDLKKRFADKSRVDLKEVRDAIVEIRSNKLPDVHEVGSAGSFFKNTIVEKKVWDELYDKFEGGVGEEQKKTLLYLQDKYMDKKENEQVKIPTAFLIDMCGLKGVEFGGARVYERQPLVIINNNRAKATDVLGLMQKVRQTVYKKTSLVIEPEPQFVGFRLEELKNYFSL